MIEDKGPQMKIGRVSMVVEIDGKACVVVLSQNRMKMLVSLAANLSDSGKLLVKKLGDEFRFEAVGIDSVDK